jgi:hypothetical protein
MIANGGSLKCGG